MTMTVANLDAVARRRETPCLIFRPIKNTPLWGVFLWAGGRLEREKIYHKFLFYIQMLLPKGKKSSILII